MNCNFQISVILDLAVVVEFKKQDKFQHSQELPFVFILAGAQGLEPGTYGFGDRRSTN